VHHVRCTHPWCSCSSNDSGDVLRSTPRESCFLISPFSLFPCQIRFRSIFTKTKKPISLLHIRSSSAAHPQDGNSACYQRPKAVNSLFLLNQFSHACYVLFREERMFIFFSEFLATPPATVYCWFSAIVEERHFVTPTFPSSCGRVHCLTFHDRVFESLPPSSTPLDTWCH